MIDSNIYKNSVQLHEIDNLGHMNVQYYLKHCLDSCILNLKINNLISYHSNIEESFALEKVNICQLINDTVDRLRPLADLRDISLEVELLHPASVLGDPILLQNALYNIIDNAIKYSPIDSKIVTTVSSVDKTIQISVNDTGPGFNSDEPSKLIERFHRGKNVEGIIGSGLGLTIVHEVVEAHKGHLEIKNLVGEGACVSFFLPSH